MTQLYKQNSKGKIQVWRIQTEAALLIEQHGVVDGKMALNSRVCTAKNEGRANETTGSEQAILEMEAKIKKKLDTNYFRTQEEALTTKVLLPMLAKEFKKEEHKVTYPCFVQQKYDGMRCLGTTSKMISRKNRIIETLPHIQKALSKLPAGVTLDGELIAVGLTFQENMKLIKKNRGEASKQVKYYVYDLVSTKKFEDRFLNLAAILTQLSEDETIRLAPTFKVNNRTEIDAYHSTFLEQGYEGTIIRHGDAPYAIDKRSSNLLKLKDFKDIALEVKDVVPAIADPKQGILVCLMPDGREVKASLKMSHAKREEILTNKAQYIGQTAELRYFENTDDGLLRFPVCHGFRLD